jgi:hypothetical protein
MHLNGLPVKIDGFLGNHLGPICKVLLAFCYGCGAKIAETLRLKIFGKTLQCLLVAPGGTDTVDPAIALVRMPFQAEGDLPGNGMLGLGFCRSKPHHAFPSAAFSFGSATFFR